MFLSECVTKFVFIRQFNGCLIIRQKKQKINTFDNATEDSYSFDLTNVYNFRKDLSYPLTGDEKINILNLVLVVSFINCYLVFFSRHFTFPEWCRKNLQ